jgi:hypothetical protein
MRRNESGGAHPPSALRYRTLPAKEPRVTKGWCQLVLFFSAQSCSCVRGVAGREPASILLIFAVLRFGAGWCREPKTHPESAASANSATFARSRKLRVSHYGKVA